ncbi:MAG: hypothetical protein HY515_02745 [Candidatus Aenigmarchaeota archaeon]|nr:hypothetical protein [Candidatus Aenigmarchaeota archaeon]
MTSLYGRLCLMKNLRKAFKKARKGKGTKLYVTEFQKDLEKNLLQLQKELRKQTYKPCRMRTFVICDPKSRVISASAFRDRVVHHALCNIIEPIFDKTFIYDSYANRKGKGTHAALNRFGYFARKVSGNGKLLPYAKNKNQVYGYVLKADIRRYFDSVDHEVMMRAISRKIHDEKVIWLARKILDNHTSEKGMPIGNLTSQFFANVYLNELDYFVKHRLKAKYYIRYVDDFVILHPSKEKLESFKAAINEFLKTIKLELHPQKSQVVPLQKGIKLLGFRVFSAYKLPKKSNIKRFEHKIGDFIQLYRDGIMEKPDILARVNGWNSYAMHANTYKFRKRSLKNLKKSLNSTKL